MPSNMNPLSPNGYQFGVQRLPNLTYFCQEVNLPDVSLGVAEIATPFVVYPIPGEQVEFGVLNVQFLVDSEMNNYKAIFDWLQGLGFPESYDQYIAQTKAELTVSENASAISDATLTILGSNSRPIRNIRFVDCMPVALSSMTFTSTAQDVQYLVGNATFRYSYYKFVD